MYWILILAKSILSFELNFLNEIVFLIGYKFAEFLKRERTHFQMHFQKLWWSSVNFFGKIVSKGAELTKIPFYYVWTLKRQKRFQTGVDSSKYAYIGTFIKYALASRVKIDNQKCAVTIELLFIGFGFPPPSNSRFYKK